MKYVCLCVAMTLLRMSVPSATDEEDSGGNSTITREHKAPTKGYNKKLRGSHQRHGPNGRWFSPKFNNVSLVKAEERRQRHRLEMQKRAATHEKRTPRKTWTNYVGVSSEALDRAVNQTLLNATTSCAVLIERYFGRARPVPLAFPNGIIDSEPYEKSNSDLDEGGGTEPEPSHPLMFTHIPKNAGTAIERTVQGSNMGQNYTAKKNTDYHGRVSTRVQVFVTVPVSGNEVHGASNDSCKCSYWHVPPRYLTQGGAAFARTPRGEPAELINAYEGAELYCVVRDPLDRALSEFKMRNPGLEGSKPDAQEFLVELAARLTTKKMCRNDCHFMPQFEYVYDWNGKRTCHHAIRYGPKLKEGFDALMKSKGLSHRLSSEPIFTHHLVAPLERTARLREANQILLRKREHRDKSPPLFRVTAPNSFQQHADEPGDRSGNSLSEEVQRGRRLAIQLGSNEQAQSGDLLGTDDIDPVVAKLVRCAYALDLCLLGYDPATGADWNQPHTLGETGCSM